MITLTPNAEAESSYIVLVSLFDENGDPVLDGAVTGISWSLRDGEGTVINSRLDVPVSPAHAFSIVLTGDDLAVADPSVTVRSLSVVCEYNSDTYGTLALAEELIFSINTLSSGGAVVLPSVSQLCRVYEFCYDQKGQTPLPSVSAVAHIIALPHDSEGKLVSKENLIPVYVPSSGLVTWDLPKGCRAHILITEVGLDAEIDVPYTDNARIAGLL